MDGDQQLSQMDQMEDNAAGACKSFSSITPPWFKRKLTLLQSSRRNSRCFPSLSSAFVRDDVDNNWQETSPPAGQNELFSSIEEADALWLGFDMDGLEIISFYTCVFSENQ